jgi:hypothetical protein
MLDSANCFIDVLVRSPQRVPNVADLARLVARAAISGLPDFNSPVGRSIHTYPLSAHSY